jgi:hypothetical protein
MAGPRRHADTHATLPPVESPREATCLPGGPALGPSSADGRHRPVRSPRVARWPATRIDPPHAARVWVVSNRRPDPRRLLPDDVPRDDGPSSVLAAPVVTNAIGSVRRLVHILAADSAAGAVAAISTDGRAEAPSRCVRNGAAASCRRARSSGSSCGATAAVPLVFGVVLLEHVLRMLIDTRTRVAGAHTPPAAGGTRVLLPRVAARVVWSLTGRDEGSGQPGPSCLLLGARRRCAARCWSSCPNPPAPRASER